MNGQLALFRPGLAQQVRGRGSKSGRSLTQQQQLDLLCHTLLISLDDLVQLSRPRRIGLLLLPAAEAHDDDLLPNSPFRLVETSLGNGVLNVRPVSSLYGTFPQGSSKL